MRENAERNAFLTEERNAIQAHFQHLKGRMNKFRAAQAKRLGELTQVSTGASAYDVSFLYALRLRFALSCSVMLLLGRLPPGVFGSPRQTLIRRQGVFLSNSHSTLRRILFFHATLMLHPTIYPIKDTEYHGARTSNCVP